MVAPGLCGMLKVFGKLHERLERSGPLLEKRNELRDNGIRERLIAKWPFHA